MVISSWEIGGKLKPVAIYDASVGTDYSYKYNVKKKKYLKAGTVRGLCNIRIIIVGPSRSRRLTAETKEQSSLAADNEPPIV